jgi:type II secretory pathway component PulF
MARFHFQVSDTEGKIRRGTMEAQSLSDAREIAGRRGYTIIELREAVDGIPEPVIKVQAKPATT